MVEECLQEEEDRVQRYMYAGTRESLIDICKRGLIHDQVELICAKFPRLLEHGTQQDLQKIYSILWEIHAVPELMHQWLEDLEDIQSFSFLSGIPEAAKYTQKRFHKYVREAGLSAIAKLVARSDTNTEELDPGAYVKTLFEVYHANLDIVNTTFQRGVGFMTSLEKACCEFVNRNVVTGSTNAKSSRLLVKYIDTVLRKNANRVEKDAQGVLNQVVCSFLRSPSYGSPPTEPVVDNIIQIP